MIRNYLSGCYYCCSDLDSNWSAALSIAYYCYYFSVCKTESKAC